MRARSALSQRETGEACAIAPKGTWATDRGFPRGCDDPHGVRGARQADWSRLFEFVLDGSIGLVDVPGGGCDNITFNNARWLCSMSG
ncbi:MAG: hypothetical protein NVS3B27_11210 [Novosphingobium sp.]